MVVVLGARVRVAGDGAVEQAEAVGRAVHVAGDEVRGGEDVGVAVVALEEVEVAHFRGGVGW